MKLATSVSFAASIALLAPLAVLAPAAHGQDQLWIRQFGTSGGDGAFALAPDGAGGVVVAGYTEGSLGGPNAGSADAYLARYDSAGNRLWIRQFGTNTLDGATALAPDGAGGVMVAGWTAGSLGGPNAGSYDVFMARYDGAGNRLWIQQFGTSDQDIPYALAPDGAGGVMVAGETIGDLGGPNAGRFDAFLARYDSAGDRLWIRQFGTSGHDYANALAPDGAGGVMVAGETRGSLGGPSAGGADVFLARYDSAGNRLWIRQFGTNTHDYARALAPDGAGGVMVAGITQGSLGGPFTGGVFDTFVARYDGAGNQLWIHQFGTSSFDVAWALAPDGAGGVMVAGYTWGSLGGPYAGGFGDVFVARYDSAGERLWIRQFGTSGDEAAYALATDGAGGVMVAGETGVHGGNYDAFLARYTIDSCYPDCDRSTGNGVLDIFDFLCFQNDFVTGNSYACDCDTSTGPLVCDMLDFLCFQNAFVSGCP